MRISQDSYDFEFVRRVQVKCTPDSDLASGCHTRRRDCRSPAHRGIRNCIGTGNCRFVRVGSTTALQCSQTIRSVRSLLKGKRPKSETSAQAPLSPNKNAKPCGKTSRCEVDRPCFGLSCCSAVSPETGLVNQVKSQNRREDPHRNSTRSYGLIIATAPSGQEICSRSCRIDINSL
jgi:hypothetical protein